MGGILDMKLETVLQVMAIAQVAIAVLNLFLVRLLGWRSEVMKMPLLLREVFYVHMWFISVTLVIFGVMTWRFAAEMSGGAAEIGRWLAGGIGLFWAARTVLQITYYSSSHWRGDPGRTTAHVLLLFVYGTFAATYLRAAFALES
jgi:hypothetical protein